MNFFNFRKNAEVAVIDFGSSKIVVFVGKKTPDGFLIVARGESKYAGFYDGEWLEPERLSDAVSYAPPSGGTKLWPSDKGSIRRCHPESLLP